MLSDRSRPVIEATLPVVADNIEEIATRFYAHLFGEHPELLDGVFNRGNQAESTQQMALAGSVAVFASALVKVPEQLPEHLLSRIAHKHASLGHHPGPVRRRPRQPVLGDRRRARRRRHARGGRRLGRGLLADGLRADQPGARPLQRPRRAAGDGLARVGGRREGPGDRRRRHLPGAADRRPAGAGPRCPASTSPCRCRCPTASASPGSTASPGPTTASTASSRSSGCAAADKPDGEVSNLLCDSVQRGRPADACRCPSATSSSTTPAPGGVRQRRHRHHPDGRACSRTWPRPGRTCRSRCCTPTSTRRPSRCAEQVLADVRCAARRAARTSGTSAARDSTLPVDGPRRA